MSNLKGTAHKKANFWGGSKKKVTKKPKDDKKEKSKSTDSNHNEGN